MAQTGRSRLGGRGRSAIRDHGRRAAGHQRNLIVTCGDDVVFANRIVRVAASNSAGDNLHEAKLNGEGFIRSATDPTLECGM